MEATPGAAGGIEEAGNQWTLLEGLLLIAEDLPDGALLMDRTRRIRYANPQTGAILRTAPRAIVGRDLAEVLVSVGGDPDLVAAQFARHLEGETEEYELRLERSGEQPHWAAVRAIPQRGAEGEVTGVLWLISDATARRLREGRIRELALQDPLTGVPNRRLLTERLENAAARAKRSPGHQFAVLFVDVDHLKDVNDTFGHSAGDVLLQTVARRLQSCLRPEDTIARFGGDEFAILLEGIQSIPDVTRIAGRIQEELGAPLQVEGYDLSTSASIGIAFSSPAGGNVEQLLHHADTAMYRAKAMGPGQYVVFDPEMHARALARLQTEVELRIALSRGQLRVVYQPIVAASTGRIAGVEALLRWDHPEHGVLAPESFLPIAEETRLIVPISEWVLARACEQMREWLDRLGPAAPGWVAVNLSHRQLLQPTLAKQLSKLIQETGLEARRLRIELRESVLADHEQVIQDLKRAGFGVHIDHYATGCSSLSALLRLRVDALKCDLSLHPDLDAGLPEGGVGPNRQELIGTINDVARGIGASTIVQGVTSAAEIRMIQRLGCEYGQGTVFAPPGEPGAIEAMLLEQVPDA